MSVVAIPCLATVAEDFEGEEGELSLPAGTQVVVVKCDEDGWWTVHTKKSIGIFPGSYLDVNESIKLPCNAKIVKNFKEMNLNVGEVVQVQDISEEGWMIESKSNLGFCTWDFLDIVKEGAQQPPRQPAPQQRPSQTQPNQVPQGGPPQGGQPQRVPGPQGGPLGGPQGLQHSQGSPNQQRPPSQMGGPNPGPPQGGQPRGPGPQGGPLGGPQGVQPGQGSPQRPPSQMGGPNPGPPQGGQPRGPGPQGGPLGGPQGVQPGQGSPQQRPLPGSGSPNQGPSNQIGGPPNQRPPSQLGGQQGPPGGQMGGPPNQRPPSQLGGQANQPANQRPNQPPANQPKPGGPSQPRPQNNSGPSRSNNNDNNQGTGGRNTLMKKKQSILNLPDPEYRFSGFNINSDISELSGRKEQHYDPYLMPNQRNAPKFEQDGRWEFRAYRDLPAPPPFRDVPKEYVSGSMASYIDWKAKERSAVFDI